MSRLVWDEIGTREFETGVDRGVLYVTPTLAVPWNGLTSVEEDQTDSVSDSYYADGIKTLVQPKTGDFKTTLNALTYPDEFYQFEGIADYDGLLVDGQISGTFGLSYRTKLGNDTNGSDHGYKIHILYGLTAVVKEKDYATETNSLVPMEFSWDLSGIPQHVPNYYPSVHISFDSTRLSEAFFNSLTDILWGTLTTDARLPSLSELVAFAVDWQTFTITDNGDGTWTANDNRSALTMLDDTTFQITIETANMIDTDSYQISSYEPPEV